MLPVALTIAGSDSGGGAGVQADLKTFHQWGVFGTSAITAITAQDTTGVHGIHPVPTDVIKGQIRCVAADLCPAAIKTGMLATAEVVSAVAASIRDCGLMNYVLDPVMVATSGDVLLEPRATATVIEELTPLADVITPNWPEAALLTGGTYDPGVDGLLEAAHALVEAGAKAALVKGGHIPGPEVVDLLFDGREHWVFRNPRIDTVHTHGTGCTLSAALAAGLAHGLELPEAAEQSIRFVHRAVAEAPGLGQGHGPLNHFVPVR
ncbi:MAG: bifunctional hydroxymethylpyrimidine kinase/phosphomethylpyrimidine kinase [Longimicrobiales bacterium]